jgi:protein TonB
LAIWATILWAFAYSIGKPSERLPEPPPIEAQIIEIPTPTINTPAPVKQIAPRKSQTTPPTAMPQPSIEKNPSPIQEEKPTVEPDRAPAPVLPKVPTIPVREEQSTTSTNLTGTNGAQAIVRPMPKIPDDLRQDALSASALARFHVATDGTATVELVKPTPNPRLNRLLLDTLKNWRFFPAMKDGKPVASTQEIVIKIEVK